METKLDFRICISIDEDGTVEILDVESDEVTTYSSNQVLFDMKSQTVISSNLMRTLAIKYANK